MGEYNFHVPQILGQEWVGIKEQDVVFAPAVNIYEVGHGFRTSTNYVLNDARFYINTFPPGRSLGQVFLATVYAKGKEILTGPVRAINIPCNSALVSGGATGTAVGLLDPSDNNSITFPSTGTPFAHLHFATNAYDQLLNGKRILAVNFLYALSASTSLPSSVPAETLWGTLSIEEGSGGSVAVGLGAAEVNASSIGTPKISVSRLGEIDHFWGGGAPNTTSERLPWRYAGLQDFEVTAASNRISVTYRHATNAGWTGNLQYCALEVIYCEENRLFYGGRSFGESGFTNAHQKYTLGTNSIPMRDTSAALNPVLVAGNYVLVISSADLGDCAGAIGLLQRKVNLSQYPLLNGLRQLYSVPPHPPIQVNVTQTVDEQFSSETTLLLPQLSLHTSGAPLTEVHSYGRQARSQVYGLQSATQEILDGTATGARPYPWVRYYARRFGTTTIPLRLDSPTISGAGQAVQITPAEFDALDEIVDGWKEITLRFAVPPTMGVGTNPQWRWTSTGELPGNRWEVLGCVAPALSGTPANLLTQIPAPQRLSGATYGAPSSGSTINLGWLPGYAPPVSATTDDVSSDAILMFAQDLPIITGFSAEEQSQELIGIGLDCGIEPCCIPSALDYVEVTWGLPANTGAFADSFTRTVAAGSWGGTPPYTLFGTATDYSVDGDQGIVTFSAVNSSRFATVDVGAVDFDVKAEFDIQSAILTGTYRAGVVGRYTNATDNYLTSVDMTSTGAVNLTMEKRVLGVFTSLASPAIPRLSGAVGSNLTVRMVGYGTFLKAKVWQTGYPEPVNWDIELNDSGLTAGGGAGIFVRDNSAVIGHSMGIDNLVVTPPQPWFSHYELQRMDTVTTDWQTIMRATSPAVTAFNDYEARVGVLSSYRIRAVDVYDFPGPWSATVTATVPEPGVTIECDDGHLLIFTSNAQQDGSINLAYSSVWEGRVEENFTFPESSFVQLQAMYNRDFFTAFRPMERGGEQFNRTVLVQAAAIAPETLADFTSLRDMAWADVPYICVRDEDGNRWFSTVIVPNGRVLNDRRLYMAPVEIIEVTDTPSEVNPQWPTSS